jgi:hypothetical protein
VPRRYAGPSLDNIWRRPWRRYRHNQPAAADILMLSEASASRINWLVLAVLFSVPGRGGFESSNFLFLRLSLEITTSGPQEGIASDSDCSHRSGRHQPAELGQMPQAKANLISHNLVCENIFCGLHS